MIAAAATLALCAAGTATSVLRPALARPFFFEDFLLADFAWASVLVLIWKTRRTPGPMVRRRILLSGLTALVAFGVIEGSVRLFLPGDVASRVGRPIRREPERDTFWILHKPVPARDEQAADAAQGVRLSDYFRLRDDKPFPSPEKSVGTKRVVWLGDSTTEAGQVPGEQRFTRLLEEATGASQYVLAVGGTSTDFAANVEERYFDLLQPDLVMLAFNPENDCEEFGRPIGSCGFKPAVSRTPAGVVPDCKDDREGVLYDLYTSPPSLILQNAATFSFIASTLLDLRQGAWRAATALLFARSNPFSGVGYSLKKQFTDADDICATIHWIATNARRRGAEMAVLDFPLSSRLEPSLNPPSNSAGVFHLRAACRDVLLKCLDGSDIPFLDVGELFRASHFDDQAVFLPDLRHLTAEGHRRFFDTVLPFERDLLTRGSSLPRHGSGRRARRSCEEAGLEASIGNDGRRGRSPAHFGHKRMSDDRVSIQ
jgi:hypothetical protein